MLTGFCSETRKWGRKVIAHGLSGCCRILGSLILLASWASCQALAAPPPGEKQYLAAIEQFGELAKKAAASGQVPRKSDPAIAAILAVIADSEALLGKQDYKGDESEQLLQLCSKSDEVVKVYGEMGLTAEDRAAVTAGNPSAEAIETVIRKSRDNIHAYQDEVIPLIAAQVRCRAHVIKVANGYITTLNPEERGAWLRSFVANDVSIYGKSEIGAVLICRDNAFSLANRRLMLRAVADNADIYAEAMPEEIRQGGAHFFNARQNEFDEALLPDLKKVIDAFSRPGCTGLCAGTN